MILSLANAYRNLLNPSHVVMIYENVIQTIVMIYRYRRAKINSTDKVEKWKKEEFRAGLTGLLIYQGKAVALTFVTSKSEIFTWKIFVSAHTYYVVIIIGMQVTVKPLIKLH